MAKIFLFMLVTLDGFYEGKDHDISWHHVDNEFNTFAAKQMQEAGAIMFGRRTYQLMEGFWPNYKPEDEDNTIVTDQMNNLPKYVFSKTLKEVKQTDNWRNISLFNELNIDEVNNIKKNSEKDIIVLGSSDLGVSLIKAKLLDELRVMINPVVIDEGKRLFEGLDIKQEFKLQDNRGFQNGNVLLTYSVI